MNSAYAVVVPLNQFACASTTTGQFMVLVDVGAGAVTDMGVTRICEATGADEMTTFVMGLGAGMVTGMAVDSLNPSVPRRPGSMEMDSGEFHTTIRELQRKGYLGDGTAAPSSFADMMSPEDSARYTHFLEYGSDSGLTPSELAGIQRLDDCLALGRVDYDEVLVLRRENGADEGIFINSYSEFGDMLFGDGKRYSAWNRLREEGLNFEQIEKLRFIPKGQKPLPNTYLSANYIENHLQSFRENGAVKIMSNEPSGMIGGRGGTFVMSGDELNEIIQYANGDVRKIESILGLDLGYLGDNPVIIIVEDVSTIRIPTGNELGAWPEYWEPGGYTSGGIKEAVIDPIPEKNYTYKHLFE